MGRSAKGQCKIKAVTHSDSETPNAMISVRGVSKSFKKNVAYNGYGASVKKSQPNLESKKTLKASSKKKNSKNFSYKRTSSSQTYSAYSTN